MSAAVPHDASSSSCASFILKSVRASGMTTAEQPSLPQQVHSCIDHLPKLDQDMFLSNCPISGGLLVLQGQEFILVSAVSPSVVICRTWKVTPPSTLHLLDLMMSDVDLPVFSRTSVEGRCSRVRVSLYDVWFRIIHVIVTVHDTCGQMTDSADIYKRSNSIGRMMLHRACMHDILRLW